MEEIERKWAFAKQRRNEANVPCNPDSELKHRKKRHKERNYEFAAAGEYPSFKEDKRHDSKEDQALGLAWVPWAFD